MGSGGRVQSLLLKRACMHLIGSLPADVFPGQFDEILVWSVNSNSDPTLEYSEGWLESYLARRMRLVAPNGTGLSPVRQDDHDRERNL